MSNETPTSFTVLLGRKPLELKAPVAWKRDIQTEVVEYDPSFFNPDYRGPIIEKEFVTADSYQLFSAGRLVAITNRFTLRKDLKTGHLTLRLFKNRTTLVH